MTLSKKIVLLGHFGVGKTSLIRRFVDNAFSEDYLVTLGVQLKKKTIQVAGTEMSLIIWDIEGKSEVNKTRPSYLMGTHGVLYVFDVSRPETYENLEEELQFVKETLKGAPINLVGNKADLFTKTFNKESFAEPQFENCFFCSAKSGDSVEEVFKLLAEKTLQDGKS